jgi:hypothetical protein
MLRPVASPPRAVFANAFTSPQKGQISILTFSAIVGCLIAGSPAPWLPSLLCERLDPFGMLPLGIRSFASASGYQD